MQNYRYNLDYSMCVTLQYNILYNSYDWGAFIAHIV